MAHAENQIKIGDGNILLYPRVRQSRELLREYILIMANSGLRKGEARMLKWRDVIPYRKHGLEWPAP
jgi:integrase